MKLATIFHEGRPAVAVVDPGKGLFWPLDEAVPGLPARIAGDMVAAIAHLGKVSSLAAPGASGHTLDGARLLAPIPAPPHNVMCVGKNYHAHAREFTASGYDSGATAAEAVPEHPIIFTKPSSAFPVRSTISRSGRAWTRPWTTRRSWRGDRQGRPLHSP